MRQWPVALAIIIISLSLCNIVSADSTYRTSQFAYTSQQKIDGVGFFNSHQEINTLGVGHEKLLGYGEVSHGSGSYKRESTLSALSQVLVNDVGETTQSSRHDITFGESTDYVYYPVDFLFGKTFKSPSIGSKGKEDTSVKDYASGVSMTSLFDSATALSKEMAGSLYWDLIDTDNEVERIRKNPTGVTLDISADVTGQAELGVREAQEGWNGRGLKVNSELEQDFKGNFTIAQKLSHKIAYRSKDVDDDWLPCCYGGYLTMPKYYRMGSKGFGSNVKAIFDCTCFESPIPQLPSKPSL